uniref:Uncharacterized protein n=1 Tax=Bird deltacoronavirus HKU20 TaxID=3237953 RepID=A0AB39AGD6_9NIDO
MAQIVKTPLEASTQAMTASLGYSQCKCDWHESKKTPQLPLCMANSIHYNCKLHFAAPRLCCLCWSDLEHQRKLLQAAIAASNEVWQYVTTV